MGVRHLQTFMKTTVPNGYTEVNMREEIRNYRRKTGRRPLIVIDVMSLYTVMGLGPVDSLCGSRYDAIEAAFNIFFDNLIACGAEVVFFCDGPVQEAKLATWNLRQNSKYENSLKILDCIKGGQQVLRIIGRHRDKIPNNTLIPLKELAKRYGVVHVAMSTECDKEIASFATKNNAFAILSNDSDFLIFRGFWRYWSSKELDLHGLTTGEYERRALVNELGLRFYQLPLFATLAGNDFIKYEELTSFYQSLGHHKDRLYNVAQFVQQFRRRPNEHWQISGIASQVLAGRQNAEFEKRMLDSIAMYDIDNATVQDVETADTVQQLLLKKDMAMAYEMYVTGKVRITLAFFDYRETDLGSYGDIVIPIVARAAGILLIHRQDRVKSLAMHTKRNHDTPHEVLNIAVEYPQHIMPPHMLELHSDDPSLQSSLLPTKLKLLAWLTSDSLNPVALDRVPPKFMVTIVTLYRLVALKVLTTFEANHILYHVYEVSEKMFDHTQESLPRILDYRATRVAFLFQKVHYHLERCVKLLGFPENYLTRFYYDGFRFHNQYMQWKNGHPLPDAIEGWRLWT